MAILLNLIGMSIGRAFGRNFPANESKAPMPGVIGLFLQMYDIIPDCIVNVTCVFHLAVFVSEKNPRWTAKSFQWEKMINNLGWHDNI
ncbi:MAG: hypothetical protein P0116_02805 [Candidatus Nitrosocosmicus sp.]|nr:hypothetical protein [Candidatus Nitrosocosmicus sp.]